MVDTQQEFDDLVGGDRPSLAALLNIYEPIESAYRAAVSPVENCVESTNTTALPKTIVHASTSVR